MSNAHDGWRDPSDGKRWLTVPAISEAAFCPRAGVLQFEASRRGLPIMKRALFWFRVKNSPAMTLRALRWRILHTTLTRTFLVLAIATAAWGQWVWSVPVRLRMWEWFVAAVLIVSLLVARRWMSVPLRLAAEYFKAIGEVATEPTGGPIENAGWWALMYAGFVPIRPEERYVDRDNQYSGQPEFVLVRGSERIPVFSIAKPPKWLQPWVQMKHLVKAEALCRLVEINESDCACRYCIVLFRGERQGAVIPRSATAESVLRSSMTELRASLARIRTAFNDSFVVAFPTDRATCFRCPWRSDCASRFAWDPPLPDVSKGVFDEDDDEAGPEWQKDWNDRRLGRDVVEKTDPDEPDDNDEGEWEWPQSRR